MRFEAWRGQWLGRLGRARRIEVSWGEELGRRVIELGRRRCRVFVVQLRMPMVMSG